MVPHNCDIYDNESDVQMDAIRKHLNAKMPESYYKHCEVRTFGLCRFSKKSLGILLYIPWKNIRQKRMTFSPFKET